MTDTLPAFDQEFVSQIFSALSEMEMTLDENPLQYGPRRLNMKVAHARDMLTEVEQIYNRITHLLQQYKRAHRTAERLQDIEIQNMLANDAEVRHGRNLETQKALALVKLRAAGDFDDPLLYQSIIEDLVAVLSVVKAKRADLKDLQARIRDQIKLCHEEIGLGERWGSKKPPGSKSPTLPGVSKQGVKTARQLREMFQKQRDGTPGEDELEIEDSPVEPEAPEAPVAEEAEPEFEEPQASSPLEDLVGKATDGESDEFLEALENDGPTPGRRSAADLDELLKEFDI